jgi:sensor histidine kinase YesM
MKKPAVILIHSGYWAVYLLLLFVLLLFIRGTEQQPLHEYATAGFALLMAAFTIVPAVVCFYISYGFLFPRFFSRKRIAALFTGVLLTAITGALTGGVLLSALFGIRFMFADNLASFFGELLMMTIIGFIHVIIGLVMRGFITSYSDIQLKEDLSRKNHEMELALIKAQLDPHFLFNTINNIDVLISLDAAKASAYLNKLSDIMRFMLYEAKAGSVPLEKELGYIAKYIDLQKIRSSNPDYVRCIIEGEPAGWHVAPMLFIPFIENAFKHAESRKAENAIRVRLLIAKDKITFECVNYYSETAPVKQEQGGLGNELIRRRLGLLYGDRHSLSMESRNGTYEVKLIIGRDAD